MTRTSLVLSAAICLGIASPVLGQTKKIQAEVEEKLHQRRSERQTHEDIEIMRRLLNRSLLTAYGLGSRSGDTAWMDLGYPVRTDRQGVRSPSLFAPSVVDWDVHAMSGTDSGGTLSLRKQASPHDFPQTEGNYIKGHGAVFSITLPMPLTDPRPTTGAPAPKTISEWERLRRELRGERGEKGMESDSSSQKKDPHLADVVLKALAENGRNFIYLPENEQLTVAITFRGPNCTACHGSGTSRSGGQTGGAGSGLFPSGSTGMSGTTRSGLGTGMFSSGTTGTTDGIGRSSGAPTTTGGGTSGLGGTAVGIGQPGKGASGTTSGQPFIQQTLDGLNQQILLGDLHAKQRRYQEAEAAYQEALKSYEEAKKSLGLYQGVSKQQQLQTYLTGAELNGKLAQVYIVQGSKEKATKAMMSMSEAARAAEGLVGPSHGSATGSTQRTAGPTAIPLAPKLTISAPKKLLDQIGQGKMTFEEFKKAVTVDYQTFAEERP